MPTNPHHIPTIIQPSTSQPQKKQRSKRPKRKDTQVPQPSGPTTNVVDEVVNELMDDSLVRAATTTSSLEADSGSGPRRQDTMGDKIAQTRFENVSKISNNSLLAGVNTPQSDEDRLKLNELMEFCTKLQQRVLELENTKTAQAQEITSLKLRVKKLEKKGGSRTHKLKRLYKGRKIDDIDKDAEITLVDETQGSRDEVTLAQALAALKSVKVQEKANVVEEPSESITTTPTLTTTIAATTIIAVSTRPRAKGLVIHEEEQATTPTSFFSNNLTFGYKQNELKNKSFNDIQKLFDKAMKRVNTFVDMDTELVEGSIVRAEGSETRVEGSSKRAGEELEQESSKKHKLEEDKEIVELQRLIEVVPDKEEVAIDAIPLATKPPSICWIPRS
ncbi:hypothetical protein Tco_0120910 [Tanacetum coccineum]